MRGMMALSLFLSIFFLSACSMFNNETILDIIQKKYETDDTVKSSVHSSDTDRVFIAKNKSINEVAESLEKAKKPKEISGKVDQKKVLVYDKYFVILTPDNKNASNTRIEVATYGFVRDNFQPSFFDHLLSFYLLDKLLGVHDWAYRQGHRCYETGGCYQGYNQSGGHYKGPGSKPLFRGSSFRGGGPDAGK
ncbi:DUF4247 domain-containing protein [Scopulibacillus cellulosilyticus]|uniref:DUF4247 domain-containing protein n=1 Tax=Scopulibacillus cellulosilyticus TaxID=2665665 RepID=A0ABW2PWY7_9BACL